MIGSIIFLTKRKEKPYYRKFISYMIAKMTRNKGQRLEDVKVHAAIIYRYDDTLYVREMESKGNINYTLVEYNALYGDRMVIYSHNMSFDEWNVDRFNFSCRNQSVKYDYKNTFIFQIVKRYTTLFLGRNTPYHRMCAEDTQTQFNLLSCNYFKTPESTNPNELWNLINGVWKINKNDLLL